MTVAASFGLASVLSVVVLGDESGYLAGENQKMKLAAMESMWETEPAPASITVFGLPSVEGRETRYAIRLPWVLGLMATRSIDTVIPGINDLVAHAALRIKSGIVAYGALARIRGNPADSAAWADFDAHVADLGYALLLKRLTDKVVGAPPSQIQQAAWSTVPNVPVLFWAFRIMVGFGLLFIAFFAFAFWLSMVRRLDRYRWFLRAALLILPAPWITTELDWIVAEYGRQPWTIDGVLPTLLSVSSITPGQVGFSLAGFVVFYTTLAVVELYLMLKYIRLGPEDHGAGVEGGRPAPGQLTPDRRAMPAGDRRNRSGHELPRLRNAPGHLVAAAGRTADRLRRDGRLRSRHRHAAALRRPHRPRAADRDQHGGTGLEGQPGLADPGRGRDLRRLARGLWHELFRFLPRHVPGALLPNPATCGVQIPQKDVGTAPVGELGPADLPRRPCAGTHLRSCGGQCAARCVLPLRRHDAPQL
jgi:Cytochrome bd terminal oxidase subunit I